MATSSSNLVCVQIKLKNETDPLRPVVRKRTRGHEVVEIPGQNFMFTRKRKQPPAPAADARPAEDQAPSAVKAAAAAAEAADLDADAAMVDQDPAEPTTTAPAEGDAPAGEQAAPAAAAEPSAAPTAFSTPAGELLEIVRWAVFNELQQQPAAAAGPASSNPEAVVAVADAVAARLAEQLGGSSSGEAGGAAGGAGSGGLQCLMVLPHQVDRLKATLLEKRDMLLQEEAAWLRLKDTYTASQGTPATTPAAAQEAANEGAAAGAVEEEEVEGQGLGKVVMEDAPVAAAAAGGEGAEEVAQEQQQQQQEEAGGSGPTVIPESPSPAAGGAGKATQEGAAEGATPAAAAGGGGGVMEAAAAGGPVCAARGVALTRVGLQVEALVGMVAKVEQLVTAAEEASRDLQATFHRERFQVFPHVNSPALLIKTIINPSQASNA